MNHEFYHFCKQVVAIFLLAALVCIAGIATCNGHVDRESKVPQGDQQQVDNGWVSSELTNLDAQIVAESKPALPTIFLEPAAAKPPRRAIVVRKQASGAQDLQAAIDSAEAGDVILLEPGATYVGNFTLPKKNSSSMDWITIRSSAPEPLQPAKGIRVSPEAALNFPKIVSSNADPVINAAPGAHHFRFIGVEITLAPNINQSYGLITFGSGSITALDQLPHDLILDRCYIHGNAIADVSRGVALNCARASVFDSYISECHVQGFDAQAIASWNGSGPFSIVNNYLEASGENVLFGGADPKIPDLVPSDIVFRGNTCSRPLSWKPDHPSYAGKHWSVKNIFELKNARRVLIEGNIFENNWGDAQVGIAILFTPRNQDGTAPWSAVEDVTFINNLVRNVGGAINILGVDYIHSSQQTRRIAIVNNLFENVNGKIWGGNGSFLTITEAMDVTVDHNTVLQTGNITAAYGKPCARFVFTNNLIMHNEYGVIGDGTGTGAATINKYFPEPTFKKNVLVGGKQSQYPVKNFFPAQIGDVGFIDSGNGNYELLPLSAFKALATDDKDIGCDIESLRVALESRSRKSKN